MDKKSYSLISVTEQQGVIDVRIETENLIICSCKESDFDDCVVLYSDIKLTKYFNYGRPFTKEEVAQLFEKGRKYFREGELLGLFSIFEKSTGEFVGQIDLFPTNETNVVEIGCILGRSHHHKGYAIEAINSVLIDLINEINERSRNRNHSFIMKVIATVHPKNTPSKKILKKLGMIFENEQFRFNAPRIWYAYYPLISKDFSHYWNPEEYYEHSSVQMVAASSLLQTVKLQGNEDILDVGCGDGKITALMSSLVPHGSVLGIDISAEMIRYSKNNFQIKNLRFEKINAEDLSYRDQFDIVFSSFALQWVANIGHFFELVNRALKSKGRLIATIPLDISCSLEQAIETVIYTDKWKHYFQNVKPKRLRKAPEYFALLNTSGFDCSLFSEVTQNVVFDSRIQFEKYVLQWFPYFQFIPHDLKVSFFQEIIDKYFLIEPILETQEVLYKFQRLDLIANVSL
jgi:trans-aconitate 2-methyltransferase